MVFVFVFNQFSALANAFKLLSRFPQFCESKWSTVGSSCRVLVAFRSVGLDALVKIARQGPKANDERENERNEKRRRASTHGYRSIRKCMSKEAKRKNPKIEARFYFGIWVGMNDKTGEYMIMTPGGIERARPSISVFAGHPKMVKKNVSV